VKYYKQLLHKGIFTFNDIVEMTSNRGTAYSLVRDYLQRGYIKSIRRNLYTAVSLETGQAVAGKYQIGSKVNKTAYISHHSAFEFYGLANQVFYEIYVSSKNRFSDFEFEGISYKCVLAKIDEGVAEPKNCDGTRVTELERTVIDSIKDFEKIGGLEELLRCLDLVTYLDEEKLIKYLDLYNLQVLYQKTGYILEHFKESIKLSAGFFEVCKGKVGKSTRYLYTGVENDDAIYNSQWQLIVPKALLEVTKKGGGELV